MKITVISLDHSKDRRRSIRSQLDSLELDFVFHQAVDGVNFPKRLEALVDWHGLRRDGFHVQMGSLANWISQCQVLQDMVENGPDVMLLLEDDALVANELPTVLSALETMIDDFDIVFLNFGSDKPFIAVHDIATGHQMGWLKWSHFGSQGYVITRRGAEVFLDHYPLARTGIDRALASYWHHELRTFCLRPPVVFHSEHFQHDYSMKLKTPIRRFEYPLWLWRLRRGWFRAKNGVAKRIVLSRLILDAQGLVAGVRRIIW